MLNIKIKIHNKSTNALPEYKSEGSVGMDVRASIDEEDFIVVPRWRQAIIKTGLYVAIPKGYEIQIRSRSGLAAKKGVSVLNSPGTIDSDYRGEIMVILHNNGDYDYEVYNGDRIAQLILSRKPIAEWDRVKSIDDLPTTDRGEGGLGSSGVK